METVKISFRGDKPARAASYLQESLEPVFDISRETPDGSFLASDLITLVVAGAGVLAAVVNAAFAYLATRQTGRIVITAKSKSGDTISIEVPWGISEQKLEKYIQVARDLNGPHIYLE